MELAPFHSKEQNPVSGTIIAEEASSLMRSVFTWMFIALGITALTAWLFANSGLVGLLYTETGMSGLGWVVTLSPLAMVIAMSLGLNKMRTSTLTLLFIIYAILMGMSLSYIFIFFTGSTITKAFLVASGMFAAMAIAGYVTQMDLSRFGSILFMALIGLIIASVVCAFTHSTRAEWIISILGVILFAGLTAWDVNSIRRMSTYIEADSDMARKMGVYCALSLYLDFINLFLYLLRIFARSND